MNDERLKLKGMLQELKMQRMELVNAAKSHMSAIKDKLSLSSMKPIEEIDAVSVHFHAAQLKQVIENHRKLVAQIDDIERELE